jgi:hypothetical protein
MSLDKEQVGEEIGGADSSALPFKKAERSCRSGFQF